jgi:hypothetical protein
MARVRAGQKKQVVCQTVRTTSAPDSASFSQSKVMIGSLERPSWTVRFARNCFAALDRGLSTNLRKICHSTLPCVPDRLEPPPQGIGRRRRNGRFGCKLDWVTPKIPDRWKNRRVRWSWGQRAGMRQKQNSNWCAPLGTLMRRIFGRRSSLRFQIWMKPFAVS